MKLLFKWSDQTVLQKCGHLINLVGFLVAVFIVLDVSSWNGFVALPFTILFSLWAILPFYVVMRFLSSSVGVVSQRIMLIITLLTVGFMLFAYIDATYINIDAQGALVFLFAPLYSLVALFLFSVVFSVFRKKEPPSENGKEKD